MSSVEKCVLSANICPLQEGSCDGIVMHLLDRTNLWIGTCHQRARADKVAPTLSTRRGVDCEKPPPRLRRECTDIGLG